jgi:hypothetical protein
MYEHLVAFKPSNAAQVHVYQLLKPTAERFLESGGQVSTTNDVTSLNCIRKIHARTLHFTLRCFTSIED